MRVRIAAIGRMKAGPERELAGRYLERAIASGRALGLAGFEVAEFAESRAGSVEQRKLEEAKALGTALEGFVVALDEHGKSLDSQAFARLIERERDAGRTQFGFAIGGADGLARDLVARADLVLSFSPLTWPHQIVRILLAEQLYRATTILSGHPYHRE